MIDKNEAPPGCMAVRLDNVGGLCCTGCCFLVYELCIDPTAKCIPEWRGDGHEVIFKKKKI